MHRLSFWQPVDVLTQARGEGYWNTPNITFEHSARPIYQQIAVALYILGGGGVLVKDLEPIWTLGTVHCGNIPGKQPSYFTSLYRSISIGLQDKVKVKVDIAGAYRESPAMLGFLHGTNTVLRYKPMVDPEAYFSRKETYGFNLQEICN